MKTQLLSFYILLLSLIGISSIQAMQVKVKPASERIKTVVSQALIDYGLNPNDYTILAFAGNYNICANSNSIAKRLIFNENALQNDDSLIYVAYHESAHIKCNHSATTVEFSTREIEADTLACKKLLENKKIRPICMQLLMLTVNERMQKYTDGKEGHDASAEYKNIESILQSAGYESKTNIGRLSDLELITTTVEGNNIKENCTYERYL